MIKLNSGKRKNSMSIVKRVILGLFITWFISFLSITSLIAIASISDKTKQVDCMIVLGAGLRGKVPSLVLEERLAAAVKYVKLNPNIRIIASGGKGRGEDIPEAKAMEKYLIEHGVKKANILKEEQSINTIENLKFSKLLYESYSRSKLKKAMIITSNFHMFRAKFLAKRIGIKPYGWSSKTPWYLYPQFLLREYFAVIKSYLFDY